MLRSLFAVIQRPGYSSWPTKSVMGNRTFGKLTSEPRYSTVKRPSPLNSLFTFLFIHGFLIPAAPQWPPLAEFSSYSENHSCLHCVKTMASSEASVSEKVVPTHLIWSFLNTKMSGHIPGSWEVPSIY